MSRDKFEETDKAVTKEIMDYFKGKIVNMICPDCSGSGHDAEYETCENCKGDGCYDVQY